jgi:hypothetical protein
MRIHAVVVVSEETKERKKEKEKGGNKGDCVAS